MSLPSLDSLHPSPWAAACRLILLAVLAFGAYVGVRFVDRATATMNTASAVFGARD